jgi:hypothetical protein
MGTLLAPVSQAQTAVDGAVGGTVVDTSGAIVSGAIVTVHDNETNAEQIAKSDDAGYFRVIHLQPGTYSVTINASGFEPYKSIDLTVQVGLLTPIDAHMQVGSTTQTVEVSGASPLVNTTNPDFAGVIDQRVLHDLPVSNYRWSSYALLTPGVVNDSNGYGLLSFRGQSVLCPGHQLHPLPGNHRHGSGGEPDQPAVQRGANLRSRFPAGGRSCAAGRLPRLCQW